MNLVCVCVCVHINSIHTCTRIYLCFKFRKENARKFYSLERVDLNQPDPPSPPSKKRSQESHHNELDTILNTLEVMEEKVTDKLNRSFEVTASSLWA